LSQEELSMQQVTLQARWWVGVPLAALLATLLGGLAAPAAAAPVVLYDGSIAGQTPADQGFVYLSSPQPASAVITYANGGTTLDTTPAMSDLAGYAARPGLAPALDRAAGFTVRLSVQLLSEAHVSPDRAGLSLTVITSDRRGIELGMWADEVWAQNDGAALFTHGEGAALNLAARPVALTLTVRGDRYALDADGARVLEGPLRSYAVAGAPYNLANFLYLGDNTSRAAAVARILHVSVEAGVPATPTPSASPTPSPTPSATASPTPSPTPSATASPTPSASSTASPTPSASPTASATASPTPSASPTASATASPTPSASATASATPSASATTSPTPSPTAAPRPADAPPPLFLPLLRR
jgi:hypothetical protein